MKPLAAVLASAILVASVHAAAVIRPTINTNTDPGPDEPLNDCPHCLNNIKNEGSFLGSGLIRPVPLWMSETTNPTATNELHVRSTADMLKYTPDKHLFRGVCTGFECENPDYEHIVPYVCTGHECDVHYGKLSVTASLLSPTSIIASSIEATYQNPTPATPMPTAINDPPTENDLYAEIAPLTDKALSQARQLEQTLAEIALTAKKFCRDETTHQETCVVPQYQRTFGLKWLVKSLSMTHRLSHHIEKGVEKLQEKPADVAPPEDGEPTPVIDIKPESTRGWPDGPVDGLLDASIFQELSKRQLDDKTPEATPLPTAAPIQKFESEYVALEVSSASITTTTPSLISVVFSPTESNKFQDLSQLVHHLPAEEPIPIDNPVLFDVASPPMTWDATHPRYKIWPLSDEELTTHNPTDRAMQAAKETVNWLLIQQDAAIDSSANPRAESYKAYVPLVLPLAEEIVRKTELHEMIWKEGRGPLLDPLRDVSGPGIVYAPETPPPFVHMPIPVKQEGPIEGEPFGPSGVFVKHEEPEEDSKERLPPPAVTLVARKLHLAGTTTSSAPPAEKTCHKRHSSAYCMFWGFWTGEHDCHSYPKGPPAECPT